MSASLHDWTSLDAIAADVGASAQAVERVRERLARGDGSSVVQALDHLDEADGLWSNLRAAVEVVASVRAGGTVRAPVADRQGRDAIHKALVLSWVCHHLFEGSAAQKVERFIATETGKALIGIFGMMEVALPFATESGEVGLLERIGSAHGEQAMTDAVAQLGPDARSAMAGVFPILVVELDRMVTEAAKDVDRVLSFARSVTERLTAPLDAAGDVLAVGMDLLPVYHLLAPRLVCEAFLLHEAQAPVLPAAALPRAPDSQVPPADGPAAPVSAHSDAPPPPSTASSAASAATAPEPEDRPPSPRVEPAPEERTEELPPPPPPPPVYVADAPVDALPTLPPIDGATEELDAQLPQRPPDSSDAQPDDPIPPSAAEERAPAPIDDAPSAAADVDPQAPVGDASHTLAEMWVDAAPSEVAVDAMPTLPPDLDPGSDPEAAPSKPPRRRWWIGLGLVFFGFVALVCVGSIVSGTALGVAVDQGWIELPEGRLKRRDRSPARRKRR